MIISFYLFVLHCIMYPQSAFEVDQ